jgi:hypothetical protein
MPAVEMDDTDNPILARVHKLSDRSREQDYKLIEHETEIRNIKEGLKEKVSAVQLAHVVAETTLKMEHVVADNALQFKHLTTAVDKIQSGVQWIVGLVIGGVIIAVLGLIFKGAP